MKHTKLIIHVMLIAACAAFSIVLHASDHSGMTFRSYEVVPSERSSLIIPAMSDKALSFNDSLAVEFSVKVNLDLGRFGYLTRLILNDSESVDILLYTPADGNTCIGITSDHTNIIPLFMEPGKWQDVSLRVIRQDGCIRAFVNGTETGALHIAPDGLGARLCMGLNTIGEFTTSDVAPMTVRDLAICADGKAKERWPLAGAGDFSAPRKYRADVQNAVWDADLNRRWHLMWDSAVPGVTHICHDPRNSLVWMVSEGQVLCYDLRRMTARTWPTRQDIHFPLLTGDFVVMPDDGVLTYVDIDVPRAIAFDPVAKDWRMSNPRPRRSLYLHAAMTADAKGNVLHLFGYGQYRYNNELRIWNPRTGHFSRHELEGISPRYLAAAALSGDTLYVYGGRGNSKGAQELGTKIYGDFYSVSMDGFEVRKLWEQDEETREVPVSEMIILPGERSFMALCYNPNEYNTGLQLRRFGMDDGSSAALGDIVPYNFLDIESEAHLFFDARTGCYYAVTACKNDSGTFHAAVYMVRTPVAPASEAVTAACGHENGGGAFIFIVSALLALAGAAAAVSVSRRRKTDAASADAVSSRSEEAQSSQAVLPQSASPLQESSSSEADMNPAAAEPGIYLLGGFRVIAADGEDISSGFSPLMKQLLSIIILNSGPRGGISNADLKDVLWADKSDESYNNNRGVTLKKIRTCLARVDASIAIVSAGGVWMLEDPEAKCDYLRVQDRISRSSLTLQELLRFAGRGLLLQDMRVEWLDSYKAAYENKMISLLSSYMRPFTDEKTAENAIAVAEALQVFDYLAENAVRYKCRALVYLKRVGSAKKFFDSFKEEYRRVMNEDYERNFSDFIK